MKRKFEKNYDINKNNDLYQKSDCDLNISQKNGLNMERLECKLFMDLRN